MTPRSERTTAFEETIAQEWSEHYFKFMTTHDATLFYMDPVYFSANPNISLETIFNHPEYEWDIQGISKNPNLTWDFIKSYKDGILLTDQKYMWYYRTYSLHYAIDYENNEELRNIGDEPLTERREYSLNEILSTPKTTSMTCFSRCKCLLPQYLIDNPEYKWNYMQYAVGNPNMTVTYLKEFIKRGYVKMTRISLISNNPAFVFEDIVNTPEINWDYSALGSNSTLRFQFILDNPTINGESYLDCVDYNDFRCEKQAFLERRRREYMSAYKIQQWWWCVTSNPVNVVCQRRLESDYERYERSTEKLKMFCDK